MKMFEFQTEFDRNVFSEGVIDDRSALVQVMACMWQAITWTMFTKFGDAIWCH